MTIKITRKKLRKLINESLQAFHYAIKPGAMRDKIKDDPNVHPKIKTLLDDPEDKASTAQAFELTAAMDPTGEYGKELDQHDHAFLSSPEYERMFEDDMYDSSVAYRSAPFKVLINKLLDDSGLRSGLEGLKIDMDYYERRNKPIALIISSNLDNLHRFKKFLDQNSSKITTGNRIGRPETYPGSNMPSKTEWSLHVMPA